MICALSLLRIPESGGKLPDYLAEISWNLEWMLSLQDSDGGVWHKQTSEQFCGFVMPEDDHLTSYIIGTGMAPYKSTAATADFAAVMAIAARCYQAYDAAFSASCLAAARQAWSWSIAHPQVTFANPPGIGTGAYGDTHCNDEILWASGELWRTTGEEQYEQAFLGESKALPLETAIAAPTWSNVAPLAYWTYAMAEQKGNATMRSRILAQTAAAARSLLGRWRSSGYGNTLAPTDYVWGSNGVAANQSLLLLIANYFAPEAQLMEAALGNLHYLLGRNCFGVSWVTQVGHATRFFILIIAPVLPIISRLRGPGFCLGVRIPSPRTRWRRRCTSCLPCGCGSMTRWRPRSTRWPSTGMRRWCFCSPPRTRKRAKSCGESPLLSGR